MICPHCRTAFHDNWDSEWIRHHNRILWRYRTALCPACEKLTIEIAERADEMEWRQVFPVGSNRGPVSPEVPDNVSKNYLEACMVLPLSPMASAALSRRCLQNMLHSNGYKGKDLFSEIDLLLNETDPIKALPRKVRETVDAIRNFGNFSAHPIDDKSSLQIIEVEDHEAEWCLEIVEELFEHFYVGPAQAAAKKAALNAKLKSAGKPPAK